MRVRSAGAAEPRQGLSAALPMRGTRAHARAPRPGPLPRTATFLAGGRYANFPGRRCETGRRRRHLSSTLSILRCSCGVAEGMRNTILQTPREFLHVRDFAGDRETLRLPDLTTHSGQRIGKALMALIVDMARIR